MPQVQLSEVQGNMSDIIILKGWPRFRFYNCWKPTTDGLRSFSVFNFYWSRQFVGICVFNFAFEYNRFWKEV